MTMMSSVISVYFCARIKITYARLQTISLLERAWKSGFDVCMLTVDTWQLGWRPTDIKIANYVCVFFVTDYASYRSMTSICRFYYPGKVACS